MLQLKVFGFPVTIMPSFWIVTALLGGAMRMRDSESALQVAIWIAIVLLSLLWHELGHAFFMRKYRATYVEIMLYAFGGLARAHNMRVSKWQDVMVSLGGPLFELTAAGIVWLLLRYGLPDATIESLDARPMAKFVINSFLLINLVWGLVNLLPVYPLDGGLVCLTLLGARREKLGLKISMATCFVMVAVLLYYRIPIFAIWYGFLAFNNWQKLKGNDEIRWH